MSSSDPQKNGGGRDRPAQGPRRGGAAIGAAGGEGVGVGAGRAAPDAVAEIQRHLLPASLPEVAGYRFAVHYRPCEAAGGDFYGFQPFADGRLGFVVADVAGHGAGAAVMMAALRSALAAFRVFGRLRESAAQDVNAIINDIAVPGMFITAFFVSLDLPSGNLYCGNCGHPPALVRRSDGRIEVMSGLGDIPLGIMPEVDPPMLVQRLGVGDSVVLYTDGVTDARNGAGEAFGDARFTHAIASARGSDPGMLLEGITGALAGHTGSEPPLDDQCVLICTRLA